MIATVKLTRARAKVGARVVGCRDTDRGTITAVLSWGVEVAWDDGSASTHPFRTAIISIEARA